MREDLFEDLFKKNINKNMDLTREDRIEVLLFNIFQQLSKISKSLDPNKSKKLLKKN